MTQKKSNKSNKSKKSKKSTKTINKHKINTKLNNY